MFIAPVEWFFCYRTIKRKTKKMSENFFFPSRKLFVTLTIKHFVFSSSSLKGNLFERNPQCIVIVKFCVEKSERIFMDFWVFLLFCVCFLSSVIIGVIWRLRLLVVKRWKRIVSFYSRSTILTVINNTLWLTATVKQQRVS